MDATDYEIIRATEDVRAIAIVGCFFSVFFVFRFCIFSCVSCFLHVFVFFAVLLFFSSLLGFVIAFLFHCAILVCVVLFCLFTILVPAG